MERIKCLQKQPEKAAYDNKAEWVVVMANTAANGVGIYKYIGTKDEVKRLLVNLLDRDKKRELSQYDYGTETPADIDEECGYLNAYAIYRDYHIDYTAVRLVDLLLVVENENKESAEVGLDV